jgi:histidine ammonia-lyase
VIDIEGTALVPVDGHSLTLERLAAYARGQAGARLAPEAAARMRASRAVVERALAAGAPVYGVNTGFGELKNRRVADADLARLQLNLLRSHAAGVGPALPDDVVRAIGLLRANSLAVGASGARPELVEHLLAVLERGRTAPVAPRIALVRIPSETSEANKMQTYRKELRTV